MLFNCGAGQDFWKSHGQQEDETINPRGNQPWIFIGRTDAEAPIVWPPDAKSWLTGGKGGNSGWDGWMASLTQWTWVWADFGRQGGIGKPGVLRSMESHRVRPDWATEQQQQCSNQCKWRWFARGNNTGHICAPSFHSREHLTLKFSYTKIVKEETCAWRTCHTPW